MTTTTLRVKLAGLGLASLLLLAACNGAPQVPLTATPALSEPTPVATTPPATATIAPAAPTDTAAPATATTVPPTRTAAPAPTEIAPPPTVTSAAGGKASWQLVTAAVRDSRAAVVRSPGADGTLYMGGNGVYRSADGGRSWVALTMAFSPLEIAVAPSDPRVLYAGTGEGCASGKPGILYRSANGGANWKALPGGPFQLQVDPANPDILLGLRCDGVYRSADGGTTWQKLPGAHDMNYDGLRLVQGVNDPATLYALYVSEGGSPLLQRSTDTGQTWTTLPSPGDSTPRDLTVDPKDAKHVYYVGSAGFQSSANGGQTWNLHNGGLGASSGSYDLSNLALNTVSTPPPGATATLYLSSGGLSGGMANGVLRWNGVDAWEPFIVAPSGKAIARLFAVNDPAAPALLALSDDGLYRLALR
jgi:photosystem II stability/assembly factor-like uncharacterized protein